MKFDLTVDADGITLRPSSPGFLAKWRKTRSTDLTAPDLGDTALSMALADLTAIADDLEGEAEIGADAIRLSHDLAAHLDAATAHALGLPPLPDLTFATDVRGTVGNCDFRLSYRWLRDGRPEAVRRTGAILHTATGDKRLPATVLDAIRVADAPAETDLASQWNALARFRAALLGDAADGVGRIAMTDFLSGLDVHLASGLSMTPKAGEEGLDFEVSAHQGSGSDADAVAADPEVVSGRIRERGALPAYRLDTGSYLVIDDAARPILEVMSRMQKAPAAERDAFVRNPLPMITDAIEHDLEGRGRLDDLTDAQRQDEIETATRSFVETEGYADRVTGIGVYQRPDIDMGASSGVTWLPEIFGPSLDREIAEMTVAQLSDLRIEVETAVARGDAQVDIGGVAVPVDRSAIGALDAELERRRSTETPADGSKPEEEEGGGVPDGPQILQSRENFQDLNFDAKIAPREGATEFAKPTNLRSTLHPHQEVGLKWAQAAWRAGSPGVLNADEQGLGKTLQTIAFVAWLKERMAAGEATNRGPVLVVAPTSLLETWEGEVKTHLADPGLGTLIRLYGAGVSAYRKAARPGRDTQDGGSHLDLHLVHEAIAENRAHRMWMLTTYQTLTNYQHSLGRIPFALAVFDEIQALKTPGTLAAKAAAAMNADFRIGLTGTPVENSIGDLWAIMDQLAPGALGTLRDFRSRYDKADPAALEELHGRVFAEQDDRPALGLRRLKEDAASYLPAKSRFLRPLPMPDLQAERYETARAALGSGGKGAVLKMLHHIRGVSLHPDLEMQEGFEAASARLTAALDILRDVADTRERALVFIEDRKMQHRFVALARTTFGLDRIDVINGSTPMKKRQGLVDRFQSLSGSDDFAILVLGPKAAGTGLTLTAATHVIHLSRWWNPAVEEQCNDRVHRIGQTDPVSVHVPMAIHPRYGVGTFDCQLHALMERKRKLARGALCPLGESDDDLARLQQAIADENVQGGSIFDTIASLYGLLGLTMPEEGPGGSFEVG